MKEKFFKYGLESFAPHEQLEFLLYYAIPRGNTNDIAHELLDRFGSLSGVLDAPVDELLRVKGIGENAAAYLKMLPQLCRVYAQEEKKGKGRPRFTGELAIVQYLQKRFIARTNEVIVLMLLDSGSRLLFCDVISEGSAVSADLYIKPIVELAARYRAVYAVLSHNHPSGSPLPSPQDLDTTCWVSSALKTVDVCLLDHFIITGEHYLSLRESEMAPSAFPDANIPYHLEAADGRKNPRKRDAREK